MRMIYTRSFCTISAVAARNSSEGFLRPRDAVSCRIVTFPHDSQENTSLSHNAAAWAQVSAKPSSASRERWWARLARPPVREPAKLADKHLHLGQSTL